jgi:SAM domain (Sterile alpha motif)
MRATLTDVQQAIEQLGHKDDFDGSQSFTFSSTRDDSTDHEMDHDTDADADGQDWHRGARQKLAEKAKKAVEEQAARDAADGRMPMRSTIPPINVEVSDDSGDEEDGPSGGPSPNGRRHHSHILEEEEEDIAALHAHVIQHPAYSPSIQPSERFIVPSPVSTAPHPESEINEDAATEAGIATATQPSFPQNELARSLENNTLLPSPVAPSSVRGISNGISGDDPANYSSSARLAFPSKSQTLSLQEGAGVLPSPAASLNGHQHGYSISSITSSTRVAASSPLTASRNADYSTDRKPRNAHPVEWTVEEVVDWLRSKGFDEMVCDKFSEQEITGDVLLELDLAILKSEIGIAAYGKRIRIANAIADLRRPPSILSSSAEQHTRPGSFSRGSPLAQQGIPQSPAPQGSAGLGSLASPESPPDSGDSAGHPSVPDRRDSDPGVWSNGTINSAPVGLGLGIPPSLLAGGNHNKAAVRVQLMIE